MDNSFNNAKSFLEVNLPDPAIRKAVLNSLADGIMAVHRIAPSCWGLNYYCTLQFTWKGFETPIIWWSENWNASEISFHLDYDDLQSLSSEEKNILSDVAKLDTKDKNWCKAVVRFPAPDQALQLVHRLFESYLQKRLRNRAGKALVARCQVTHRSYGAGFVDYLRSYLQRPDIPQPKWYNDNSQRQTVPPTDVFSSIDCYLKSKGYFFSPVQIASFYTALQTKGFVILSGISGTGKTKLAQLFAEMLPAPCEKVVKTPDEVLAIKLMPDHMSRHRFIIPRDYFGLFNPPEPNKRINIPLTFQGKTQMCWMRYYDYPPRTPYLLFWMQDQAVRWISDNYKVGDTLLLRPQVVNEQLVGLTILSSDVELNGQVSEKRGENCKFLSVRPDWRDSKSLLGYYNPLTKTYEKTPFLEFLLKANENYMTDEKLAWFVILDEMNLARVEHYFADLLSVLESGREQGFTKEALRFQYSEIDAGDPPPAELKLPPNLYIIGTVNVDETTQSFSPKVLDRAFSLEFLDVNFNQYISSTRDLNYSWDTQKDGKALLKQFSRQFSFTHIDKEEIAGFVQTYPDFAAQLQALNDQLQMYTMHFGYRVFDEIIMFLNNAEENGIDVAQAFDQAVLMKVLPKFHGSRGKLEKPLHAVLCWCAGISSIEEEPVKSAMASPELTIQVDGWRCPSTAKRVLRMIQSLNSTGFASFG